MGGKLASYQAMRDFARTPEPKGTSALTPSAAPELRFFIQRHAASRLHYDFRLELDGALLSWAIPKGPSLDPHERRLAVHVEDHPLEYGTFEGVIPQGNYGAGTVLLWDRGNWIPEGDAKAGLKEGRLKFTLEGEKLRGRWTLVRMRPKEGEDADNWLLIKERDAEVREADITVLRPESVAVAPPEPAVPEIEFQLATRVDTPPAGKDWIYEIKLDGYRMMALVSGGHVRLRTRGGQDWTGRFPRVVRALQALPTRSLVLDGEMVVLDRKGVSNFGSLATVLAKGDDRDILFQPFDLLWFEGEDLRPLPLVDRKVKLVELLRGARGPLRGLEHLEGDGAAIFQATCGLGLEGTVAKRAQRPYVSGRGRDWVKLKCLERQELVVVGWSDPRGSRSGFGALLLGVHRDGSLRYAGKVGAGFSEDLLQSLSSRMAVLARSTPAVLDPPVLRAVHWIAPELVAEVRHAGWTAGGRLRHPSFVAIREDKPAKEVEMEQPGARRRRQTKISPLPTGLVGMEISSPDRVIDSVSGFTKGDLAAYYAQVAGQVLPGIVDRPLSVLRCPAGAGKVCFFQKHLGEGFPAAVKSVSIEESAGSADAILIRDLAGLIGLVQMGVIELHPWGSRADDVERPDRLVLDLDPDPELPWARVVEAARRVRTLLEEVGLVSFPRTTGGKGLHVVVPVQPRWGWEEHKTFARGLAERMVATEPDRYTATSTKTRRAGRVYVDYLRNGRGATAVASWSVRARPGLPVAVPVAWEELGRLRGGDAFGLAEALKRAQQPDPWAEFAELRQALPAAPPLRRA